MQEHLIPRDQIDPDAQFVVRQLQRHRFTAYIVGGSVRDLLIGRCPKDFDVSTSATPREIRRLFSYARVIGRRFKLVHIIFKNHKVIETATFRKAPVHEETEDEEAPDLLIRDDNLYGTPEEDAFRRDFTVNGLFYDPRSERIIDFVGGLEDIDARRIRCIGDPDVRFQEDPVRILRALRFSAKLGFSIEEQTWNYMQLHRERLKLAAPRRVRDETWKLLLCWRATDCVKLAADAGVLQVLAPELVPSFEDEASAGVIFRLLDVFDAEPPEDPKLHSVMMAPILFHRHLIPLWDVLDQGWKVRNETLYHVCAEVLEPLLQKYGFTKLERAHVRELLQLLIRLGHPARPGGVSERVRSRPLFALACNLWEWIHSAMGVPPEEISRACATMIQKAPAPRRRRRRPRKREVSP